MPDTTQLSLLPAAEPVVEMAPKSRSNRPAASVALPGGSEVSGSAAENVLGVFTSYAPLAYKMPFELLQYMATLARFNPDVSQAVENTKILANSGYDLFVTAGSDLATRRLRERLLEKSRIIQEPHGGFDGLITKLLDQAAVYGAMCGEWVPNEDLTDIVDFIDVNPKDIRFFWEDQHWAPYQKVERRAVEAAEARGQKTRNGNCIKLNETTFRYYAFDAAPGSPYGTPPFLAALENIAIQRDMMKNMAQIVKKMGLLGVIDVAIESIQQRRGETASEYQARAGTYLADFASAVKEMMTDGGLVHFDDSEVKTHNISGNAAGAQGIIKTNEEFIFSGLKSMPSVQGRSYSTTETYAGVAYDIIIRNTFRYQRACKRMIESGYWLMVQLWAEQPKELSISFHANKSLHRLQDAQAALLEIKVALMKWASGIYDQQQFAQSLGENDVATEYTLPPDSQLLGNSSPGGGAGTNSTDDQIQPPTRSDEMPDSVWNEVHRGLREIREQVELLVSSST